MGRSVAGGRMMGRMGATRVEGGGGVDASSELDARRCSRY